MASDSEASARTFQTAINSLKQTISPTDAIAFQSTSIEDVWKSAEEIQEAQRKRKSLRNMRRIEPFLKGLEKYSKVIEVLCNGNSYLPWVWAPIKLMLQLADEYVNVFDKLVDAYSQIGEVMPQVDRLQNAFGDDPNFKVVLGLVYTDILEFHRRAYKFFRRRSWHIFFDSLWKSFDFRFQGILKSLTHHRELLMKEVITIDIVAAKQWRIKAEEEVVRQEKQSKDYYLHDSISWLKVAGEQRDDELERLSSKRQEGTCEWVFRNPLFQAWKDDGHSDPILWVKGIPGAGKTVLSTFVIERLAEETGFTTAYHICNSYTTGKNLLGEILRSITAQLLRANLDLAPYIFENYANRGLAPSIIRLRKLLPELLATIPSIRIIVDGLDEYPETDQRIILAELLPFAKASAGQCRILFSNREGTQINKTLSSKPTISLRDQHVDVNKDIEAYVHSSLGEFRGRFSDHLIDQVERRITAKADGMFLWVRLVMQGLEHCYSSQELINAVDALPEGLDEAYGRILRRVMDDLDSQSSKKAVRILQWIACSFRLLKLHEVQDGIVFNTRGRVLNEQTKLADGFLNMCKPLIEEGPKNTVDFVHYSAKEYILHEASGPFLYYNRAHYDLAFSCLNYMNSSLCFMDPAFSEIALKIRVLKGFHGLHHYANEFWFQHTLQYAKREDPVEDEDLDESLEEIQEFWKQAPGNVRLKLDDTTSADNIEAQLDVLNTMPHAQRMGFDMLTFRKFLSQEKYSHQGPESLKAEEVRHDPAHFSEVSQRYQTIVRALIDCPPDNLPEGIQPHELEKFKAIYLDSAFICRYRECPRYSDGFKSAPERDEHERLHAKPLRCADPSCVYFARGFTSKTGLLKHNRKCHPLPEEIELPAFEPRKEPELEPQYVAPPRNPTPPPPPAPRVPTPQPPSPEAEKQVETRNAPPREKVKRGKKGLRVHPCNVCGKVFTRAEGVRRHELSHGPPQFQCSQQGCQKSFYRLDLLERHKKFRHTPLNESTPPLQTGTQSTYFNSSEQISSQEQDSQVPRAPISVQLLLNSTLSGVVSSDAEAE